jgi:uncharacterized protein (TIGR03000 family)
MSYTGYAREYYSPPLTPGKKYHYHIQAKWSESGGEITQTKRVVVEAGARVLVDFPLPPATEEQAPPRGKR